VFRPARRGDLDNTLKSILDSLTGIAWDDDSQVRCIYAERREDKVNPRVEVEIIQP
jgi:Holliday junction resolvase RusA-like endonuclease